MPGMFHVRTRGRRTGWNRPLAGIAVRVETMLGSLLFFIFGGGMIYVTWINPSSLLKPIFSARWSLFGRVASRFGATAQSLTWLALGLLCLLAGLKVPYAELAFIPLGLGVAMSWVARLGDLEDDEI